jgi:hypothetical protein
MVETEAFRLRYPTGRWNVPIVVQGVLFACLAIGLMHILYPILAVRDADGYAYIMGARSLHAGNGYQSLTGEPFNHWPPGFSLLLSLFPDSIGGAKVINYSSFGISVGLFYCLLRQSEWDWQSAASLCIVLASGFWRLLANNAHADIFTYAVFLLAVYLASRRWQPRALPSLLWAALIPVKLIAAVFIPPALGADAIASRKNWKELVHSYIPGVLAGGAGIACILLFNRLTIHVWVPASMAAPSFQTVLDGAKLFIFSIPREFLFGWHGSITAEFPRIAFPVSMVLAAICLMSLRPSAEQKWFIAYGALCLVCSGILLCVRNYDPSVRLVGYGLVVLFLGFRPVKWARPFWLGYGAASFAIGIVNAMTVNSLGSMDPRYAELVTQFRPYYDGSKMIATNSFHLLDIHGNIPSVSITDYGDAEQYDAFLWVTLPSFDPGSTPVTEIAHPGPGWCEQKRMIGAILFGRCNS